MADENNVDILLSVDLDASETLKTVASLRAETADLKKEQKELDRTTAEGRVEYERLNTQIKANNKTIQQYEKSIVNAMTQEKAQEGSIKSMRAELSNAKAAYADLSKAERDGAKGRELLDKTAALNAELKELEAAYGDNQRKVGDYETAGKSLRTELRDLTEQLATLAVNGQKDSEVYAELAQRASVLKDAQADVNAQITQMASDTAAFDTMLQGAQAVTAAYGVWKSTSAALGIENEALDQTMQKMVLVMGALQSLTTLQNLAQKQSNIYRAAANILQKIGIKQTTAETVATSANAAAIQAEAVAENASAVAKTKGVVATKLITAAQWLWNAAMSANPVMLLVVAVAALIAGITALIGWMNRETEAAKESRIAEERLNQTLENGEIIRDRITKKYSAAVDKRLVEGRREIQELRKNGASEAEILRAQAKIDEEVTALRLKNHRALRAEWKFEVEDIDAVIAQHKAEQESVGETSARYHELAGKIQEARDRRAGLVSDIENQDNIISNLELDNIERESSLQKSLKDTAKTAADAAKARVDAAISAYEKEIEAQRKYNEARLKAEAGFQSADLKTRQDYARRIFELNQTTERARLDNLRKYNRITEAEYAQSLAIMQAQLTEFSNGQISELNNFFEAERKAILGMLTQTLDEQLAEVENQYVEAIKRLNAIEPPSMFAGESEDEFAKRLTEYEAFALKQANIAIRLEEERNKRLQSVRESHLASQIKQLEDATQKEYSSDLSRYQTNERKKLDVSEKMLRELIAKKKAAGLETFDDEAQLESVRTQRIALNLNKELLLAEGNAKKVYDAKATALNSESALFADNADKQLEIAYALAEAERELIEARIASFQQWSSAANELFSGFTSLMNANLDAQLQRVKENYDKESLALADKYAKGLLTEAQYNKETLKLDQKREREEAKIERKRAIRERAGKVFSVVTDTAMGIVKSVAASPLTGGMPWAAIVAAIGALNLATILAEPLPKAARGGLIAGPSHRAGGTVIEAEGGEAIMTKKAVSLFGPILSALNQLGGGVPFAGPLSDGGYMVRQFAAGHSLTADEVAEAMRQVQIFTIVQDINRGQRQLAEIESRGVVL